MKAPPAVLEDVDFVTDDLNQAHGMLMTLRGRFGFRETRWVLTKWSGHNRAAGEKMNLAEFTLMTLTLDAYSRRRLLQIRWLFQRGVQESLLTNPRSALISIPLFFTSAEQLISLLANLYGLGKSPEKQAEHWNKKAENIDKKTNGNPAVGSLSDLFHVAALRNGSLHSGSLYSRAEVEDSRLVIRTFLGRVVTDFFGADLWSISATEMVSSLWVRNRLRDAEASFAAGDRNEAMLGAGAALNVCLRTAAGYIGGVPASRSQTFDEMQLSLFPQETKGDEPARLFAQSLQGQIDEIWRTMGRTALFNLCDRDAVNRYLSLRISISGPAHLRYEDPPLHVGVSFPDELSLDDAGFLIQFTTDLALELEAMGLDLESKSRTHGFLGLLKKEQIASTKGWFALPDGWKA